MILVTPNRSLNILAVILFSAIAVGCGTEAKQQDSKSGQPTDQAAAEALSAAQETFNALTNRGAKFSTGVRGAVETRNGQITADSRRYSLMLDLSGIGGGANDDILPLVTKYHLILRGGQLGASNQQLPVNSAGIGVLTLDNTSISDAGIPELQKLEGLKMLSIGGSRITQEGVTRLQATLGKSGTRVINVNRNEEEFVAKWIATQGGHVSRDNRQPGQPICSVSLNKAKIANEQLSQLQQLPHLRELYLSEMAIGDAGLAHLKKHTALQRVSLYRTNVTDAGLAHLKGQPLRIITLSDTRVGDAGLNHLAGCKELEVLGLRDTQVTDQGLTHMKALLKLRVLDMANTRITDAGVAHLLPLKDLVELDLSGTEVSDSGLSHFKTFSKLRNLSLPSKVSVPAVRQLREAMPNCHISR